MGSGQWAVGSLPREAICVGFAEFVRVGVDIPSDH